MEVLLGFGFQNFYHACGGVVVTQSESKKQTHQFDILVFYHHFN